MELMHEHVGLLEYQLYIQVNSEKEIIFANPVFLESINYSKHEIQDVNLEDLGYSIYHGGKIFGHQTTERLKDNQQIVSFLSKDKVKKYYIESTYNVEDSTESLYKVYQDVTRLVQDIYYYEYTSKSAGVGGWEFDVINKKFRANQEVYDIHEVGLHSFSEIVHPFHFYGESVQKEMYREFRDCILNQEPKVFERLPFVAASGKHKWVRLTFTPVTSGKLTVKVFGSLQDITSETNLNDKLTKSEKNYRNIVEASNDLIWSLDLDANIIFINKASERILGYKSEELLQNLFCTSFG